MCLEALQRQTKIKQGLAVRCMASLFSWIILKLHGIMQFKDYAYQRPDLASVKERFSALIEQFKASATAAAQAEVMAQVNALRQEAETMYTLCYVRHSIDTNDAFYDEETKFYDHHYPELNELVNDYYRALIQSPFRAELEAKWGKQLFILAELSLKSFEPTILQNIQRENELDSEYRKIKAQAKLELDGKAYNLSTIGTLEQQGDRDLRRRAAQAKWAFYAEQAPKVEGIYHELVQNRHAMAQALGYPNYVGLGYARMRRSDYNAAMVAKFREQIVEHIVPITQDLYRRQAKRLGLERLKFYDEGFRFPSGNPKPKGDAAWQVAQAKTMYSELSQETGQFFDYLQERSLMDLESKDGKEPGGYCTFIPQHGSPFIFANFNGTSHDVVVLTHEAGHAFQCYATAQQVDIQEYMWPTYEACEIHSMSMEFLTWPWMHLFFQEDTDKFMYMHLESSLRFLPYGAAVDEFQHWVYEHPQVSTAERNAAWRAIERKYLPHRDYDGLDFLEQGGAWQQQHHIFDSPFYYIDYVLAQICAFQFWKRFQDGDKAGVWADYYRLCQAGGSRSFLDLVRLGNLKSPFEEGTVASVVGEIKAFLDRVDDRHF
jgi:M3 family oligoendopeptidase